jgi:riboflavin kinase/FMN adenylyltransferase
MAKIRDEIKFDSFEALKDQIQADAAQARLLLA